MDTSRLLLTASISAALLVGEMCGTARAASVDGVNKDETVAITSTDRATIRIGSGVVVSRKGADLIVATAEHVVAAGGLSIHMPSGEKLDVIRVDAVPGFDLALLTTSAYVGPAPIATIGVPALRVPVHVWGHRFDRPYVESTGSIVDLNPDLPEGPANGRFAIACESCGHGDSGAGVFDSDGRLLGILEGARRDATGDVAFVQCEPIEPAMETALLLAAR